MQFIPDTSRYLYSKELGKYAPYSSPLIYELSFVSSYLNKVLVLFPMYRVQYRVIFDRDMSRVEDDDDDDGDDDDGDDDDDDDGGWLMDDGRWWIFDLRQILPHSKQTPLWWSGSPPWEPHWMYPTSTLPEILKCWVMGVDIILPWYTSCILYNNNVVFIQMGKYDLWVIMRHAYIQTSSKAEQYHR